MVQQTASPTKPEDKQVKYPPGHHQMPKDQPLQTEKKELAATTSEANDSGEVSLTNEYVNIIHDKFTNVSSTFFFLFFFFFFFLGVLCVRPKFLCVYLCVLFPESN